MTAATPGPCHKEIQSRLRAIAQIIHRATTTPGCERQYSDDVGWAAMGLTARREFRSVPARHKVQVRRRSGLWLSRAANSRKRMGILGWGGRVFSRANVSSRPTHSAALRPLIAEPALALGLMTNVFP